MGYLERSNIVKRILLITSLIIGLTTCIKYPEYEQKGKFVIVGLPDTQYYSESWLEVFEAQIQWILANKDSIDLVVHLGDIVQDYDNIMQWKRAYNCMSQLSGEVPYLVIPGNHNGFGVDWSYYDIYFPYSEFDIFAYYGGHFPDSSNANNYGFATKSKDNILIVGLSWNPDSTILRWADSILTKYSPFNAIVFTHEYLDTNGVRSEIGERIWKSLISKHLNILLVMNGHYFGSAQKVDTIDGHLVYQHLYNYQYLRKGGSGWLRIYTIDYDADKIDVTTYSPYLNEYKEEECFSLPLTAKQEEICLKGW